MTNFRFNKKRLIVLDQRDVVFSGDVAVVELLRSVTNPGRVERDGFDAPASYAAANCLAVEHPVERAMSSM